MDSFVSQLDISSGLAFVAGFVAAFILIALLGSGTVRLFVPVVRLLAFPFRPIIYLLRVVRVLPKAAARTRPARFAALGATSVIERGYGHKTEIEKALLEQDDAGDDTPEKTMGDAAGQDQEDQNESADSTESEGKSNSNSKATVYDFEEEESHLKRDGFLFRSIRIMSDYFPTILTSSMSEKIADQYLIEAQTFFNRQVALGANEKALYEDAEGAFIISRFRKNDRRCYYVLNEMRKTINGNALRLILLFTFTLATTTVLLSTSLKSNPMHGIFACAGAIVLMLIWHIAGYQKQQQHNVRELRSFLTRYLGRISDRYREATAMARGVTVGDETDSQKLSEAARKWHKILIWLPFRTFFIECFVRNALYQIHRNCGYYLYLVPVTLSIIGVGIYFAFEFKILVPSDYASLLGGLLVVAFLVVVIFYVERINSTVIAEELDQLDWLGYDNLNVSAAMDDVVGKYAEDVGFWKGRLDR